MIAATPETPPDRFAARLVARARALAEARLARLALEKRRDPRRWRRAALVWPLFARR